VAGAHRDRWHGARSRGYQCDLGHAGIGRRDSGGAIYTNRSGGGVNAVGIHSSGYSAGEYYAPCTGIPESDIRKCGWRILWVDLEQTFAYYGGTMTLLTELGA
jgi:hypothetical protein